MSYPPPATGEPRESSPSGRPAAMLLHFSPGAPREEYFERLPHMRGHSDEERRAFFERHDTCWV